MTAQDTGGASSQGQLESFLAQIPDEFATLEAAITRVFETGQESGLTKQRIDGWLKELNEGGTGGREGLTGPNLEDQIRDDIVQFIITKQVIQDFYGVDAETADQLIAGANEGGINFGDLPNGGTPKGMPGGGTLVKVERDDGTSYFAMRYTVGGVDHLYSFASESAARQAVGNLAGAESLSDNDVNNPDGNIWNLGDAAGLEGLERSYNDYFDDIMGEAALEAGIQNPGMLGRYISDPEIMKILARGEAGDWGDERIQAAIRGTEFYLEVLYPGIEAILEQGIGNPEAAWKNYNNTVEATLQQLGYARDDDGSYRSKIGEMLDKGILDAEFVEESGIFIRAEQSPQFKNILDQWVQDATGKSVSFDEWFDVLAGTTTPELDAIVEKATIQFQAEQSNVFLSQTEITRIAELTQFSEEAVGSAFSSAEQQLLALGDVGLQRKGLSVQKLIDATLDIGEDAATTRRLANKALRELGIEDDPKATFFTGFTTRGAPQRTGLLAGSPEAG